MAGRSNEGRCIMEAKNFTVQAKDYFGLKPEQNVGGFSAELKGLTAKDKLELAEQMEAQGFPIKDLPAIREAAAKA
jgi:hypothetical protein